MSTLTNVETLPHLDDVYKRLYASIKKYRPTIEDRFQECVLLVKDFDLKMNSLIELGITEIRNTFWFIEQSLNILEKHELPQPFRAQYILENYKRIYTHANYWYVLLDGVILEGVFEAAGEEFLRHISKITKVDMLEILQDIVDPLTQYHYVRDFSSERLVDARQRKEKLHKTLLENSDGELARKFERFIAFYSEVKRWHEMFTDVSKNTFQKLLPPLRDEIILISEEFGVARAKEMPPWDLLDLIEEELIPAICRHYKKGKVH